MTNPSTPHRMRRLRQSPAIRRLVQDTHIHVAQLIYPLFIREGQGIKKAIQSMPGQYQLSLDHLTEEILSLCELGITQVLLFGIPDNKDAIGSAACQPNGVVQKAIKLIKQIAPEMLVIADLCFCEYTSHGHCGVLTENGRDVDNDATLPLLVEQALSLAAAGVDIIAPSGMMDHMVHALRQGLDLCGYQHLPIMSYAVKFASHYYGPFREAAEGTPQFGDRRSYQMDIACGASALREAELDIQEGADLLIVKPAGHYLDIIYKVKQTYPFIPVVAYQVSGEYAAIKAATLQGWLDEQGAVMESLIAIKRSGADLIITYFAKTVASWLKEITA